MRLSYQLQMKLEMQGQNKLVEGSQRNMMAKTMNQCRIIYTSEAISIYSVDQTVVLI